MEVATFLMIQGPNPDAHPGLQIWLSDTIQTAAVIGSGGMRSV